MSDKSLDKIYVYTLKVRKKYSKALIIRTSIDRNVSRWNMVTDSLGARPISPISRLLTCYSIWNTVDNGIANWNKILKNYTKIAKISKDNNFNWKKKKM